MAPRILILSIAMGANYSFEVKNIEILGPSLFKHNNSFVGKGQLISKCLFGVSNSTKKLT
jgi:hypothetical protein